MYFIKNKWSAKASSAVLNLVVCLITLGLVLLKQNFFGQGDTYAFLFWTVPLAAGIAVGGDATLNILGTSKLPVRLVGILFVAVALAYGWVWLVYLVLEPWVELVLARASKASEGFPAAVSFTGDSFGCSRCCSRVDWVIVCKYLFKQTRKRIIPYPD